MDENVTIGPPAPDGWQTVLRNGKHRGLLRDDGYGWEALRPSGVSKEFEDKDAAIRWLMLRSV